MSMITQILISDLITFLFTVIGTAFVMGQRFGRLQSELTSIKERLYRIEAMFELRLRQEKD